MQLEFWTFLLVVLCNGNLSMGLYASDVEKMNKYQAQVRSSVPPEPRSGQTHHPQPFRPNDETKQSLVAKKSAVDTTPDVQKAVWKKGEDKSQIYNAREGPVKEKQKEDDKIDMRFSHDDEKSAQRVKFDSVEENDDNSNNDKHEENLGRSLSGNSPYLGNDAGPYVFPLPVPFGSLQPQLQPQRPQYVQQIQRPRQPYQPHRPQYPPQQTYGGFQYQREDGLDWDKINQILKEPIFG